MKYEDWQKSVPDDLKQDALWQFNIDPKTVFLYDLLWEDCERLMKDVRGKAISAQIIRSAGSISANIEEGWAWLWGGLRVFSAGGVGVGARDARLVLSGASFTFRGSIAASFAIARRNHRGVGQGQRLSKTNVQKEMMRGA
jgi:hypothetical protein